MKGMFPPHKVHDPPDEYKFEDVNAIPLDKSQDHGGSERGRKGRPKMHVPNWGNQQASYQPTTVFDNRFFWVKIEHTVREEDDDPMAPFTGLCDRCSVNKDLDRDECDINKNYDPNCSANYTLRSLEEPQKERTWAWEFSLPKQLKPCMKAILIGYHMMPMQTWKVSCVEPYLSFWTLKLEKPCPNMVSLGCTRAPLQRCWKQIGDISLLQLDSRGSIRHQHFIGFHVIWETNYMQPISMLCSHLDSLRTHSEVRTPKKKSWGMQSKLF